MRFLAKTSLFGHQVVNRLIWKIKGVVDAMKAQKFYNRPCRVIRRSDLREQGWTSAFMERSVKSSDFF